MSATDVTLAADAEDRLQAPAGRRGRIASPRWLYVALSCAILATGGALRWWQEQRLRDILAAGEESPFPLRDLPMALGDWRVPDGREGSLEPEVERILGCADYIKRTYVNEQTGVGVEVLVLYGPTTIAHRPDLCYPGSGYAQVDGPRTRTTPVAGGEAAADALVFAKGEGAAADRQQVIYSLRYNDRWTAQMDYKLFGRLPGMYKIQLARRVGERERPDAPGPSEALLGLILPEIERRLAAAPAGRTDHSGESRREDPR